MSAIASGEAAIRQLRKERSSTHKGTMARFMMAFLVAAAVLIGASAAQHTWAAASTNSKREPKVVSLDADRGRKMAASDAARSTPAVAARTSGPGSLGVSRMTPEWQRLLSEGLYHQNSSYFPKQEPRTEQDIADNKFWPERVLREWSEGCQRYKGGVKKCLPKLIIIGMFKCGTTAMFDTIAQHPAVLLPRKLEHGEWHEKCPLGKPSCVIKEVNGFVRLGDKMRWSERAMLQRYGMGLMPNQTEEDTRPVLEASPYYFAGMVDAADDLERIIRYIPDVKLIAMVRNPIDRAFSEYLMFSEPPFRDGKRGCSVGHGTTFEDIVQEEMDIHSPRLLSDQSLKYKCLFESTKWQTVPSFDGRDRFQGRLVRWGEYQNYAEAWMRILGPDRLMFVKNEDLDGRPEEVMKEVYRFAGLPYAETPVLHSNFAACRGSIARGAWTPQMHEKANSGECARMGAGRFSHQKTMTPDMAHRLMEHFRGPNQRFTELTGIPTEDWAQPTKYLGKPDGAGAAVRREERRASSRLGKKRRMLQEGAEVEAAVLGETGYLDGPDLLRRQLAEEPGREVET